LFKSRFVNEPPGIAEEGHCCEGPARSFRRHRSNDIGLAKAFLTKDKKRDVMATPTIYVTQSSEDDEALAEHAI